MITQDSVRIVTFRDVIMQYSDMVVTSRDVDYTE